MLRAGLLAMLFLLVWILLVGHQEFAGVSALF